MTAQLGTIPLWQKISFYRRKTQNKKVFFYYASPTQHFRKLTDLMQVEANTWLQYIDGVGDWKLALTHKKMISSGDATILGQPWTYFHIAL